MNDKDKGKLRELERMYAEALNEKLRLERELDVMSKKLRELDMKIMNMSKH